MTRARTARHLAWLGIAALTFSTNAAGNALFDEPINEGELRFLPEPPAQPPHRHSKHLTITRESIVTGWVRNTQCHYNLDNVPAMEIVFGKGRVRELKVTRRQHIGRAWIENDSVQMTDVGADAFVCLSSENAVLKREGGSDRYVLQSGPYMRRFLDGYFPMKLELIVDYPADTLLLAAIEPRELKAAAITAPGQIKIDALFEGKLTIELRFARR